jgi:hypothetical protein
MEKQFLVTLPADVRWQVMEIEDLTRNPIDVKVRRIHNHGLLEPTIAVIHMMRGNTITEIIYSLRTELTRAALIHEIQHLYRNVVQGIEALELRNPNRPDGCRLARILDNDIEHLFIIPIEFAHTRESRQYWEAKYDGALKAVVTDLESQKQDQCLAPALRRDLLRHWLLVCRVFPNWSGRSALESALKKANIWRDAQNLLVAIEHVFPDKVLCIQKLLKFGQLSVDHFRLVQYQVTQQRVACRDVPLTHCHTSQVN